MEKQTDLSDKIEHYNDWGRKTFETATKYIEYYPLYIVPAKQYSITTNPKKYGQDRKSTYIKSTAGSKRTAIAHSYSKLSLAAG